jgi:hypothetical protein
MHDQKILKAKLEHANYTVADQPYEFSTTMTLDEDKLKQIHSTDGGVHIPLSSVIDNYDKVENRLKRVIGDQYSLDDHKKLPINFLLVDAGISGIKSPDPYGGMTLGGSITLPAVHAATLPTDELTPCRRHRKLLPINQPHYFINGNPHAFSHTLSHHNVDNEYKLLGSDSKLNSRMVFPSKKAEGSGGELPSDPRLLVDYVKGSDVFLHGHVVDQDAMYPSGNPTVTEILSADARAGGSVKSQYLVAIKNGNYPVVWWQSKKEDEKHIRDEGAVVPIDDFAYRMFHFIDSCNEARSTNFDKCCIWWDIDHLNIHRVPKITAKLKFKILPVVPYHEEGKEFVPYQNFVRHLKSEIDQVDKPFQ